MKVTGFIKLNVAALVLAIIIPPFLSTYYTHMLITILFWGYLGACWNLLGGYAGQFSLGHAAFFGIGSYTSSLLFVDYGVTPWFGMLLGGVLAMLISLFVGYLVFRYGLKGPYFALAMLAVAGMFHVIAVNWKFVKAARGILIPLGNSFWLFTFEDRLPYYYIILAMMVGILILTKWVHGSRMGYYFIAIREDQDAAAALGIDIRRYKIIAMALSAFTTAFAGTFYAQYYYYIDSDLVFSTPVSIDILLRCIIGGPGTIFGPLVGSILLTPLSEITRSLFRQYSGLHLMIFASILIAVIHFLPRGVIGLINDVYAKIGSKFGKR